MTRYANEAEALADGIRIEHQADASRYALLRQVDGEDTLVGEAHYTLIGSDGVDFDHTLVIPELRGTGLSGLLARHAVTGEVAEGRWIRASCWYIAAYLERHPELARPELEQPER